MAFTPLTGKKPLGIMEKKIVVNPRYANISSVVDTGAKINTGKVVYSNKVIAKRREELFVRITSDQLASLIGTTTSEDEDVYTSSRPDPPRISLTHVEEISPLQTVPTNLILDIRSEEEYLKCHIIGSTSYPLVKIMRDEISYSLHSMRRFVDGKNLIIYGLDDKAFVTAGTTLIQKGWENPLVLSGGLMEFSLHHPSLIIGTLPRRPHSARRFTPRAF